MRFQKRDGEILLAIYENDGVFARRHLKEIFWSDKSWRAMEVRLSKLHQEEYIDWPTRDQYKINPISEPVCWLGWRGALLVAGKSGVTVEKPNGNNKYQLRKFQKELKDHGVRWVSEPPWSLLNHNLAVIDIKLAVQREVEENPLFTLEQWIPESVFRAKPDVVEYPVRDHEGNIVRRKKGVCPDASFFIVMTSTVVAVAGAGVLVSIGV